MKPDPRAVVSLRQFVEAFCSINSESPDQARSMICSALATCLGILFPDDRKLVLATILAIAQDLGDEIFEDGQDFLQLMREKAMLREKAELKDE